jgi:tetratricopeptide (TPR) repeat protein
MLNRIVLIVFVLLVIISAIYALRDTKEYTTNSDEALQKYEEAMDLFSRLYHAEGFEALKEALELDSNFAMAWAALAARNHAYGYKDEADQNLKQALSQYDRLKKHEKMMLDIQEMFFGDNEAAAVEILHEFTRAFPDRIEGHQGLGMLAWEKGEIEDAIFEFEKILEIDPEYAPVFNSLGYLEFGRGNFDKSLEHFKTYISLLPDQANPYDSKGEILMAVGRYDEALKEFKTAHQLEPGFAFVLYHMADAYSRKGMYSKTDQILDKIEKLISSDNEKRELMLHRANLYVARGENEKARKIGTEFFITGKEKIDSSWLLWGHVSIAFSMAEINRDTAWYHLNKASELIDSLMPEKKSDYLGDQMGWFSYVRAMLNLEDENYAEILYMEDVLKDKRFWRPDSRVTRRNLLAAAYFGLDQKEKAYELINVNLQIDPNFPYTLMTQSKLYEKDGKIDLALKTLERLFEVYKDADEGIPRIEEQRQKYAELTANPA